MLDTITIIVLTAVIAVIEIMHYAERRDLYNRIMSRDVQDYKALTQNKPKEKKIPAYKKIIDDWRKDKE